jgi:hypothetical protein
MSVHEIVEDGLPHSSSHERQVAVAYARTMACRLDALSEDARATANEARANLRAMARALRNFADLVAVGAHFRDAAGDRVERVRSP